MPTNTALLYGSGSPPTPVYERSVMGGPPLSLAPRSCNVGPYQEPHRPHQQLQRQSTNAAVDGGSYLVTPHVPIDSSGDVSGGRAPDARARMAVQPRHLQYTNPHQRYDGGPQRYGPPQQREVVDPPPPRQRPEQQFVPERPPRSSYETQSDSTVRGASGPPPYFPYIQEGDVYYRNTPCSPYYKADQELPPYSMSSRQGCKGRNEQTKPCQYSPYPPEDGTSYYELDKYDYRRMGPKSSPPPRYRPYPPSLSHHHPRLYQTHCPPPLPQFQPPPGRCFHASSVVRVSYPSTGAAPLPPQSFRALPVNNDIAATPTRKKTDLATTPGNKASTGPPSVVSSSNKNADSSPSSVTLAIQDNSPPCKQSLKAMPSTPKTAHTRAVKQPESDKKQSLQEDREQPQAGNTQKIEMYDDALLLAQVAALARGEVVVKKHSHVDDDHASDNKKNIVQELVLHTHYKEGATTDIGEQNHPHSSTLSKEEEREEEEEEQRPDRKLQAPATEVTRNRSTYDSATSLLNPIVPTTAAATKRRSNEDVVQRAHPVQHSPSLEAEHLPCYKQSQSPSSSEGQDRQPSKTLEQNGSRDQSEGASSRFNTSAASHGRDDVDIAVSTYSKNGVLAQPTVTDLIASPETRVKQEHNQVVEQRSNDQTPPPPSRLLFPVPRPSGGHYGDSCPLTPSDVYEDEPTAAERWKKSGPRIAAEQYPHHRLAQTENHRLPRREYYVSPSPTPEYSYEHGNRHSLLHPLPTPRPAPRVHYVSHPLSERERCYNEERFMHPLSSSTTVAVGAKSRVQFMNDKRNNLPNNDSDNTKKYNAGGKKGGSRIPPPPHSSGKLYYPPPHQCSPRQASSHHFSNQIPHPRHGPPPPHHLRQERRHRDSPYEPPIGHQQRLGVSKSQFETLLTPGRGGIFTGAVSTPTSAPGMRSRSGSYEGYEGSPLLHQNYCRKNCYEGFGGGDPPLQSPHIQNSNSTLVKRTILRRKCAWKNYPELESFLIANREDYLRHSAMNYTIQQKQYNNRLTERLLEVAAKHNYVFDENDFNFVAVRDRIRCYYKSYVQSSKKRGENVGFGGANATKKRKLSSSSKPKADETRGDESEDHDDDDEEEEDYVDNEAEDLMCKKDQVNSGAGVGRDDVHRNDSSESLDSTLSASENCLTEIRSVVV